MSRKDTLHLLDGLIISTRDMSRKQFLLREQYIGIDKIIFDPNNYKNIDLNKIAQEIEDEVFDFPGGNFFLINALKH